MADLQIAELVVLRTTPRIGGLCRDCRLADTCTFPRDPARPVRSCDEFEPMHEAAPPAPYVAPVQPVAEGQLIGLCRECARRATCRYPKLLGGVWHCNELA